MKFDGDGSLPSLLGDEIERLHARIHELENDLALAQLRITEVESERDTALKAVDLYATAMERSA